MKRSLARSQIPSPAAGLRELPAQSVPVSILQAFFNRLPPQNHIFFRRAFIVPFPVPVQVGPNQFPFPANLPILNLRVPKQQAIIFRNVVFNAYEQNGLDPTDVTTIEPRRTATFLHYSFKVGNRSLVDATTNLRGAAGVLAGPNVPGGGVPITTLEPFGGSTRDAFRDFAIFGMSDQGFEAKAVIIRPPPMEIRRVSVEINGFVTNENTLRELLGENFGRDGKSY